MLKPDGLGYLAVPNRWQWVEPHYRLAFLSWLSEGVWARLRRAFPTLIYVLRLPR